MNYRHINTGIEKGLEEEELAIALPPLNLTQTSMFSLLINNRIVDCLIARQQKVLGLTFVETNYQLLASYTLLFTPDHSGYVWNTALETLKLNLHKAIDQSHMEASPATRGRHLANWNLLRGTEQTDRPLRARHLPSISQLRLVLKLATTELMAAHRLKGT